MSGEFGSLAGIVFWGSAVLLAYVYFGYPILAAARAALARRSITCRAPIEPFVSIVVVANNEEARIAARIENLLALDYPCQRREIVVASDGSTDTTVARARIYERRGVSVRAFSVRRGKSAVLNAIVPGLRGDIVLFADARQRFDAGTLRTLVENFADPNVGAVSGELVLATSAATAAPGRGSALYWRYEKFIRSTEGRVDSTVGATGAIYAIRRHLFEPIPDDTVLDDVLIPLRIVRRGYRALFDPRARAYDLASPTAQHEFVRKARTIAGTFQLFSRELWLFSPRRNRLWLETMSHKALRLTLPLLHAALFVASASLSSAAFYQAAFAAQVIFYAAGIAGCAQGRTERSSPVVTVPSAICLLSWATVVGFVRFLTNRQQVTWDRVATPRVTSRAA